MATIEEILSHFQLVNITPDKKVLNKCLELCQTYNVDAEDFVDQWFAYTASNLNGAPPSVEALDKMERKEFKQSFKKSVSTPRSKAPIITNDEDNNSNSMDSQSTRQDVTPKYFRYWWSRYPQNLHEPPVYSSRVIVCCGVPNFEVIDLYFFVNRMKTQ